MSTDLVLANQISAPPAGSRSIVSTVLDRVRGFFGAGGARELLPAGDLGGSWGGTYGSGWWLGADDDALPPQVTEASVLGVPAFGRGVDLIASTVAGVELRSYRYDLTQQIDVRMEPAPEVLRDPDPLATPWNWRYGLINDLVLYGNHFAYLGEPNAEGWPRWLLPVDATKVALAVDQESGAIWWRVGSSKLVPFGELFHVSAGARSGQLLGRGVIRQYFDALGGLLATDRHARKYFARGGLPSAVIQSSDPDFSQPQADTVKQKYRETIGAGSREPLVLNPTLTFTPVVSDAEKQQLVAARQWDAHLAALVLGIPVTYLGLSGPSMTYSNVEQVDIGFIRDTVDRWAKPVEGAVTKWLLPRGQTARFDWSGRMRYDRKTNAETQEIEIRSGTLTKAEARQMNDRPPLGQVEAPAGGTVDPAAPPTVPTAPAGPPPAVDTTVPTPEVTAR